MFEGPESELTLTENAQPALMAESLAVIRVLEAEGGFDLGRRHRYRCRPLARRVFGAGGGPRAHRRRRGAAGQASRTGDAEGGAGRSRRDGGAARPRCRGSSRRSLKEAAGLDHDEICAVANDNAPGQVVVSGHTSAVERAIAIGREHGARRSVMLPVSAPFHSPLMAPAAEVMAEALAETRLQPAAGAARRQCHRRPG